MFHLVVSAYEARDNLNWAATEVSQHSDEAAEVLKAAIPFLESIIKNPGDVPDDIAGTALDTVYVSEAICAHPASRLARNCVQDVLVRSCCRSCNPDDTQSLNDAFVAAIGHNLNVDMLSRLHHAKRQIYGNDDDNDNARRRRPRRERLLGVFAPRWETLALGLIEARALQVIQEAQPPLHVRWTLGSSIGIGGGDYCKFVPKCVDPHFLPNLAFLGPGTLKIGFLVPGNLGIRPGNLKF